jgi:hypothetical protein
MRLFHFSDRSDIDRFEPRPVAVPASRKPGHEWLNGPLVWAIDELHQPLYLFPRDCPRILLWATEATTPADRAAWLRRGEHRMVACIERAWLDRVRNARLFRYLLPSEPFESLGDAGMWVSSGGVAPLEIVPVDDLPAGLAAAGAELRVLDSLAPLRAAQASSLHVSAIRLRNSATWNTEGG